MYEICMNIDLLKISHIVCEDMSERVHKESVDLDNKQVMLAALSCWRGYTLKTAKCGTESLGRDNLGLKV